MQYVTFLTVIRAESFLLYLHEYDTGTIKWVEKERKNKNRRDKSGKNWSNYCIKCACVCMRQTEKECLCISVQILDVVEYL